MPEAAPSCAVHRDRSIAGICTRCGLFMCRECRADDGRCQACVARDPALPDDGQRARRAQVALMINAVAEGFGVLVTGAQLAGASASGATENDLTPVGVAVACQGLLQLTTFVVTIVLFLQWWHLMMRHAHQRGVAAGITPGFAVGVWFIPFVNLVRPYRIASNVASGLGAQVPIGGWWGAWVASNILTNISARMTFGESETTASLGIGLVGSALSILAALLAIQVIRGIHAALAPTSSPALQAEAALPTP